MYAVCVEDSITGDNCGHLLQGRCLKRTLAKAVLRLESLLSSYHRDCVLELISDTCGSFEAGSVHKPALAISRPVQKWYQIPLKGLMRLSNSQPGLFVCRY